MADQGQGVQLHPLSLQPQCKQDNRAQQQQQEHPTPPAQQGQQIVHLNWSHVKVDFSGKPDEDAEAHLLCTNDCMTAHHFVEGVKVQRFCFNTIRRSKIMVSFNGTNKQRLARVTKCI